jgi:hypothetical protein
MQQAQQQLTQLQLTQLHVCKLDSRLRSTDFQLQR